MQTRPTDNFDNIDQRFFRRMSKSGIGRVCEVDIPHDKYLEDPMRTDRSHVAASVKYRACRKQLLDAETMLRDDIEAVAELRRQLPPGPIVDYAFQTGPADLDDDSPTRTVDVTLSDLFGQSHDTLVVYHLMYGSNDDAGCPMCSSWIDGINGVAAHLDEHVSFAVIADAPIHTLRQWARTRGWHRVRIISSHATTFATDLGIADEDGSPSPAVSVFSRRHDGSVEHRYTTLAFLADGGRGLDLLSPIWNVLDLTPSGRPDWWPSNDYPVAFALSDMTAT